MMIDLNLSLKEQVGQMIMAQAFGRFRSTQASEYKALQELVANYFIGGLKIYHGYGLGTVMLLSHLESLNHDSLLIAADVEEGLGQQIVDAPPFPPAAALGSSDQLDLAEQWGYCVARESLRVGINMLFSPLLDLHTDSDQYFGTRCLSGDPERVANIAQAYLRGVRKAGALCTVKYFPGQGSQRFLSDGSTIILKSRELLYRDDWYPFREMIRQNVDAIMVGFGSFPELDDTPWPSKSGTIPAALSRHICTDILRNELGFDGLIITDALNLRFLAQTHTIREIACMAVTAGADVLVALSKPEDAKDAILGVYDALNKGLIAESQITRSVCRIMQAKKNICLDRLDKKALHLQDIAFGNEETIQLIEKAAQASVALLKVPDANFPLRSRPLEVVGIAIGSQRIQDKYKADPWQPWHQLMLPEKVLVSWQVIDAGSDMKSLSASKISDISLVVLLESTDDAVKKMQEVIEWLGNNGSRVTLILAVRPNLAIQLAHLGWASIWVADFRQASRYAALSVVFGEAQAKGNLCVYNKQE